MKFSIIIPSYLGSYNRAAINRTQKFLRCLDSCLEQTYTDIEIIVISHSCPITVDIVKKINEPIIRLVESTEAPTITKVGMMRNLGLKAATGSLIVYLDTDDMYGANHLQTIADNIAEKPVYQWWWFNDMTYNKRLDKFVERQCALRLGLCGTSNIVHRSDLDVRWTDVQRYGHEDYSFITKLMRFSFVKIKTPEYLVCHVPAKVDY